jgi:hypothetical protein
MIKECRIKEDVEGKAPALSHILAGGAEGNQGTPRSGYLPLEPSSRVLTRSCTLFSAGPYAMCDVKGLVCLGDNARRLLKLMDKENRTVPCDCLPMCESVSFQILEDKLQDLCVSSTEFYNGCRI